MTTDNSCSLCGAVNHATVDQYKKIILEIMVKQPNKKWSKEEVFKLATEKASNDFHKKLGVFSN